MRGLTANLAHRGEEREALGKQSENLGHRGRRLAQGILGPLHLDKVTETGWETLVHRLIVRDVLGALPNHQHQLESIRDFLIILDLQYSPHFSLEFLAGNLRSLPVSLHILGNIAEKHNVKDLFL